MSKILGYLVLIFFTSIYIISSSTELTENIETKKMESTSIFQSDKYRYGDLFDMSYLPQYKIPLHQVPSISLTTCDSKPSINLYAVCDSYLFILASEKKFYCGVDSFLYARINYHEKLNIKLDSNKKNILLFELSERNLRPVLTDTAYMKHIITENEHNQIETHKRALYSKINGFIFNESINTNLEMNIWEFSIFTPIKELKAYLNYKLFNVVDKNVVVSPDQKYLLFNPTIDTTSIMSGFNHVSQNELNSMVNTLNGIYDTAKNLGFNEVYLAIIPNPVSILFPDYNGLKYNRLLTRIQNSPELKMSVFDIYPTFKNTNLPIYLRSDTHWSMDGAHIWLNNFNEVLRKQAKY